VIIRAGEPLEVRLLKRIAIAACTVLVGTCQLALAQDAGEVSKVSLVAESDEAAPGKTLLLGLRFELSEGWHIYWNGRNDTGFAPEVDWTLPKGVTVGPLLWPTPKRYVSPGDILDHVYEGTPTILVPITIEPGVEAGTMLKIAGKVEWLVCNELCLPGFGSVTIEVTVAGDSREEAGRLRPGSDIAVAASRLPRPVLPSALPDDFTIAWSEDAATVRAPGATSLAFYPARSSVALVSMLDDAHAGGDSMRLRLAPERRSESTQGERRLVGVLAVKDASGELRSYQIDAGPDGFRAPAHSALVSRVRQRVGGHSDGGG
jgi:DsbC/DsbD-like thiol-disulfide interchange protein